MNLPKVLYILENDNNLGYNLSTHGDIEKISFYPDEKEVLFFPFSSFEIKSLEQIEKNNEIIYEIKLVYLGKYLKDIEDDDALISNEFSLPESEFATQLMVNGLIQKEILMNLNTHVLYCNFKKYEDKINDEEQLALDEINKIKEYYEIEKNYEEQLSLDELDNYDSDESKENIDPEAAKLIAQVVYQNNIESAGVEAAIPNLKSENIIENKQILDEGVNVNNITEELDAMLKS